MSVRTTTDTAGNTLYSAKQVFETLGLSYNGAESSTEVKGGFKYIKMLNQVGNHMQSIYQYAIPAAGVEELCKRYKKPTSLFGFSTKPVNTDKEVAGMKKTISDLKTVVAQLLTKDQPQVKSSTTASKSVKVVANDPLQVEARKQTRELVQDYASNRADELGITEAENRRIFYDLSFKALYNAYKLSNKNKVDLKVLAEAHTTNSGVKTSGLQMAEKLGLSIDLLKFAKSFYN